MYRAELSDGSVVRFHFDADGRCRLAWRLTDRVFGICPRPIALLGKVASDAEFIEAAVAEAAVREGREDLRVVSIDP